MTEKKHIAQTIKSLPVHPMIQDIFNKSTYLSFAINEIQGYWNYDLMTRKPGRVYSENGIFQGVNLDLACFLYALLGRDSIINVPHYKSFRQTRFKKDQELISKFNRNGQLIGVLGNKDNFRFSIRIIDQNVIGEDKVGDFRTLSLTDFDGTWYNGWQKIEFVPTRKENRFLTENNLWTGNTVIFRDFVHPNRWTSFFGHHYIISKLLIARLTEERAYLNKVKKRMLTEGISYPPTWKKTPLTYTDSEIDAGKQIQVDSFEVEIDFPDYSKTTYRDYESSQDSLVLVSNLYSDYGKSIERLRFMTRVTELSHYNSPDRLPSWLKGVKWEKDYVPKGKRSKWERLVLFQPGVGETAVSIRKRSWSKSERVSEHYQP